MWIILMDGMIVFNEIFSRGWGEVVYVRYTYYSGGANRIL